MRCKNGTKPARLCKQIEQERGPLSNDSANRISMKTILNVTHVYGAEPAGILLQMTTNEGEVIDVFLSKALVTRTREILQNALDKHLPR
jgi:hypothetical protein